MKIIKKLTAMTLMAALSIGLTACGKGAPAQKDEDLKPLTVVLDYTPNTNHTGLYVALDKGYYKEAGVNVAIEPPPEDGAAALVAAGKAQFGVDFQDLLAAGLSADQPLPVTAVAALIQHNTSGLVSLENKNIKSPKDLVGKTYGTWNSPIELAMVREVIAKDGGDPNGLKTVPNNATDTFAALNTNMDAVWIYYGWDGIAAKEKGLKTNYMAFSEMNPVFDYYTPVLIANNEFLKKDPETAKRFLAATEKGYRYAIEHPDEAADILLKHAQGLDAKLVKASQEWLASQYIADAKQWGIIDAKRWNNYYAWLAQKKLIPKAIPENVGFSNDYLSGK